VVDDEAMLGELMALSLEEHGYNVLLAHDGQVALEMMRNSETDIVVTDFMMPRMNGLELARAIRSQQRYSDLPIILVSGIDGSIGREHPELFDAVLDRPHPPEALIEKVESVLA